jgi:RNA polymerase sigma-70 factor (ECF subfamily)
MTSVGFGLAQALYPWWLACARLLSSDDADAPDDGERRTRGAGQSEGAGASEPDLEAFWRGDDLALAAIYRRHARALLGAARGMVGPADAESVVHEVFVELLRNQELRRRFTGGSLAAWLGAIARRKGFEHLRRAGRAPAGGDATAAAPEPADPSPEPRLEARDFLLRFLKAGVPAQQAEFFRRRFLDGHTQVQVAAALGIPRSTLEGWEHRLADRLRRFIWEDPS